MSYIGGLQMDLTVNDGQAIQTTRRAGRVLRELQRDLKQTADSTRYLEKHFDSLGTRFRHFMLTAGAIRFALIDFKEVFLSLPIAIVRTASEIERMTKLMEGLSNASTELARRQEAINNVGFVFDMAKNAPFEVKALTDAFVKFKSAGLDPTNGMLQGLVESVAKFGGSSEHLKRASVAIQQMAGKGVVSMEELRQQLGESVPDAIRMMARGMEMSMAELVDRISRGTVEATSAITKMLFQMEVLNAGSADRLMQTWNGLIEQTKTKWELFKNEVAQSGGFDVLRIELRKIVEGFDGEEAAKWAKLLGDAFREVTYFAVWAKDLIVNNLELIKAALMAFVGGRVMALFQPFNTGADMLTQAFSRSRQAVREFRLEQENAARTNATLAANAARDQIRRNEELIRNEQKRAYAEAQNRATGLRDEARAINQSIAQHKQRSDQLLGIAAEYERKRDALIEQAEARRRSKKAGSSAEARRLMGQADQMNRSVEIIDRERAAIARKVTELEREAKARAGLAQTTRQNANYITEATRALNRENVELANQARVQEQLAQQKSRVNALTGTWTALKGTAMASLVALRGAVIGFTASLAAMAVQMGVIYVAVQAAITVWQALGREAREAARLHTESARIISNLDQGVASQSDLDYLRSERERLVAQRNEAAAAIRVSSRKKFTITDSEGKAIEVGAREALEFIQGRLDAINDSYSRAAEIVTFNTLQGVQRGAEQAAQRKIQSVWAGQNQELRQMADEIDELSKDEVANRELLLQRREAFNSRLLELSGVARTSINEMIESERANLDGLRATYGADADGRDDVRRSIARIEGYQTELRNLEDRTKSALIDPNRFVVRETQGDGGGANSNGLEAQAIKIQNDLNKALVRWRNIAADASSLDDIREEAASEIYAMLEAGSLDIKQGKNVTRPQENDPIIQDMIEQLAIKKVIDAASRELPRLRTEAGKFEAEARAIWAAIDGDYDRAANRSENKLAQQIERLVQRMPEAAAEMQPIIDQLKRLEQAAAAVDLARIAEESKKALDQMSDRNFIEGATTEVERVRRRHEIEIRELDRKHQLAYQKAQEHEQDITQLQVLFQRERQALLDQQSRDFKTPLDKLRDQWADVTRNMQDATKTFAERSMSALTQFFETGKFDARAFAADFLKIILDMQVKKVFGGMITNFSESLMGSVGGAAIKASTGVSPMKEVADEIRRDFAGVTEGASTGFTSLLDRVSFGFSGIFRGLMTWVTQLFASSGSGGGGGIFGTIVGSLVRAFVPGLGGAATQAAAPVVERSIGALNLDAFANGGIMTEFGSVPLRKYANGGIARTPQLAMFGEGSMAEAYVPLPDGRSIPVTMSGAGSNSVVVNVNVTQTGTDASASGGAGNNTDMWKAFGQNVAVFVREELVHQSRPGGLLAR